MSILENFSLGVLKVVQLQAFSINKYHVIFWIRPRNKVINFVKGFSKNVSPSHLGANFEELKLFWTCPVVLKTRPPTHRYESYGFVIGITRLLLVRQPLFSVLRLLSSRVSPSLIRSSEFKSLLARAKQAKGTITSVEPSSSPID